MLSRRRIRRRLASTPVKLAKQELLICLSVEPSLSSTAPLRMQATASSLHELHEYKRIKRLLSSNKQIHFRPVHLFVAVVSLMLLHQRADTFQPSWPAPFLAKAEATDGADSAQQHQYQDASMFVDTKYWIRDMEFGESDNWRAGLKPCTLIERIVIEQDGAVISLGDSMDALGGAGIESNIRELTLAPNGVLLMEEDTVSIGAIDPLFVQYLNQSGDCYDSTLFAGHDSNTVGSQPRFHFEPESNAMSWFNPNNWHSLVNEYTRVSEFVHDSQKIPCSEDAVVFGSRQYSFWPTVMGNERAKTLAFKVNFRALEGEHQSFGMQWKNLSTLSSVPSLRVSRLIINEHSYSQAEFDQLVDMYGDQLFQFHDERSIFGERFRSDGRQDTLVIDDSSIQVHDGTILPMCHEEAGCSCGNERPDVMQIICSFLEPVPLENLPCRDPIQITGYCDKVCATSLVIIMDPDKFKETFVASEMRKHVSEMPEEYFSGHVFMAQHRVDHNRYEIAFRLVPADDDIYQQILGRELELAQRIKESLERSAIKSFYGIRSISIRSSVEWRRNSQPAIMWVTFAISASVFILMFVHNDEMFPIKPLTRVVDLLRTPLLGGLLTKYPDPVGLARGDSFLGEPMMFDQDGSVSDMPMDHIQVQDLASIILDTQSITSSTQNLIEPESHEHTRDEKSTKLEAFGLYRP